MPCGPERSETDSGPTRRGMGNSTQRRSLDQRGRSATGERSRLSRRHRPAARAEVGEAHGTDEAGNDGGGTGPHFWSAWEAGKDEGIDVSLETPEKIRSLQTKLYAKAKAEPA